MTEEKGKAPSRAAGIPMLFDDIARLRGVGEARAKGFAKLGVRRLIDLLLHLPRRYEDRRVLTPIARLKIGQPALIKGKVVSIESKRVRARLTRHRVVVEDESGNVAVNFFNQDYVVQKSKEGQPWFLFGMLEFFGRERVFMMKEIDIHGSGHALGVGTILPRYPATSSTPQKYLRNLIAELTRTVEKLKTDAPVYEHMPGFAAAVRKVHLPTKLDEIEEGRRRLAMDEFVQIRICVERSRAKRPKKAPRERRRAIELDLPYDLLETQKRIIGQIEAEMDSEMPMRRLVEGDVGSGKTVIAVTAAAHAAERGLKTAFICPTEILAEQHHSSWREILSRAGLASHLLTGGVKGEPRRAFYAAAEGAEPGVFFGTHALLSEKLRFTELGLVVIDEQQRFGVVQRDEIIRKGEESGLNPDMLTLSATPIPRTLAMTLYGDLEISTLKGLLPGRTPVETLHLREAERKRMMPFIRESLSRRERIYIVYPIIDEDEELNLRDAEGQFKKIREAFPEAGTALLTGRTKTAEKESTMRAFRDGAISILVSTSVIEVGIDVPDATLMIIEHAEYFGLAQLHQLRGRVGRGGRKGRCVLTTADVMNEYAEERIKAIIECSDGFRIAEEDLRLRGPGEVLGERQHGGSELRVANLAADYDLVARAQELARTIVAEDPGLARHEFLRRGIEGWETSGAGTA